MTLVSYRDRILTFQKKLHYHELRATRFVWLRAAAFVSIAGLLFLWYRTDQLWEVITAVGCGILFGWLVNRYSWHESRKRYYRELIQLNEEELRRVNLQLSGFKTGENYLEKDHPYQYDLDIFGHHSLFQLLNHCALEDSEQKLAHWLSGPADAATIRQRQAAVAELTKKTDWLQDFQANSRLAAGKRKKEQPALSAQILTRWAQQPASTSGITFWRLLAGIFGTIFLTLAGVVIAGLLPYQVLYATLLVNGVLLLLAHKNLTRILTSIDQADYLIATYYQAISAIEKEAFQSERLKILQQELLDQKKASQHIRELTSITMRASSRSNMFYLLLDAILLLDHYLLADILQWKKTSGAHVSQWLEVVHEFEALISLAAFSQSHPDYTPPVLAEHPYLLVAEEIGHPLIEPKHLVRNDYELTGKGAIDIVTGSNMSGKSTFQRTLGINLVLANMGAPVCARHLQWSPCQIFTSMRTKDNLEESTSSFYAELKRIRQLLDLVADRPVFFLLDEILKGTNSEDRHKGAIALALKLTRQQAFGLISTHDLALGELASGHSQIRNFSFNSEIIGQEIRFDYRLTPGICQNFNASQLMKNMGILD